jgi:hypothetical protein
MYRDLPYGEVSLFVGTKIVQKNRNSKLFSQI